MQVPCKPIFLTTHLDQELIPPTIKTFESVWSCHIICQHATVGTTVESNTKRLEPEQNHDELPLDNDDLPLLAGCVPDLHSHQAVINHHLLGQEISTNGSLVLVGELLVDILVHQGCLAHA